MADQPQYTPPLSQVSMTSGAPPPKKSNAGKWFALGLFVVVVLAVLLFIEPGWLVKKKHDGKDDGQDDGQDDGKDDGSGSHAQGSGSHAQGSGSHAHGSGSPAHASWPAEAYEGCSRGCYYEDHAGKHYPPNNSIAHSAKIPCLHTGTKYIKFKRFIGGGGKTTDGRACPNPNKVGGWVVPPSDYLGSFKSGTGLDGKPLAGQAVDHVSCPKSADTRGGEHICNL